MVDEAIAAVCSEIRAKHINTLYGHNVELLNVKPVVQYVKKPLGFKRFKVLCLTVILHF